MPLSKKIQQIDTPIKIREIILEDIPKIYRLGEKLFSSDGPAILYRAWDQYEIAQLFFSDTEYCLVATTKGQPVGFIFGTVVEKPRSGRQYGYVLWLGVMKKYQGQGLADTLVRRLLRRFRKAGVHYALADTTGDNTRAIRFFSKHGFTDQQDHVYLTRNLTSSKKSTKRKK